MKIVEQISSLRNSLNEIRQANSTAQIGFVPTMGALHEGHLQLVREANAQTDYVVVSIFVNPTQFNDPEDLKNYPRTIEKDAEMLKNEGVDLLFLPSVEEMYPKGAPDYHIEFGQLDKVMEGKYRAGHFKGVAMVVERFLRLVEPDKAYFGQKDFQQLAIIKHLVKLRSLSVQIIPVQIVRAASGLALSSRNELLSPQEKQDATIIYETLMKGRVLFREGLPIDMIKEEMLRYFETGRLKLEYLEIVDENTLQSLQERAKGVTCCIAAYCGKVRLIDNMRFD